jgi:hypothetical protein
MSALKQAILTEIFVVFLSPSKQMPLLLFLTSFLTIMLPSDAGLYRNTESIVKQGAVP